MRSFLPFLKIKIECPVLRKNVPVSCVYLWVIFLIYYAVLSVHKKMYTVGPFIHVLQIKYLLKCSYSSKPSLLRKIPSCAPESPKS